MRILVLGASGMLGNAMMHILGNSPNLSTVGTVRSDSSRLLLPTQLQSKVRICSDVQSKDYLNQFFLEEKPQVVINCIGLVKQIDAANDPLQAIPINSLLPHYLAQLCTTHSSRLIHVSTDCVFSGEKGNYVEDDFADARELYGLSKYMGEVTDSPNAVTLRTSIIGHELNSSHSLIDWFLSQSDKCLGFTKAIYSGLPTVVLAKIIRDLIIPNPSICGLYHVSSEPISKYELLKLVARIYKKNIEIIPNEQLVLDRSLSFSLLQKELGYRPDPWESLVEQMYKYRLQNV